MPPVGYQLSPLSHGSDVDRHVGKRLRRCRAEIGIGLIQLSNHLAVSIYQIEDWETGHTPIPLGVLVQAAHLLQVQPSEFFDGLPEHAPMSEHPGRGLCIS